MPRSEAPQDEFAQSRARTSRIVRDRVAPRFDPAGERSGYAGRLHRGVKPGEFGIAAVEIQDMHRVSSRRRFADHRDRVGGYHKGVSQSEISEIRVLPATIPDRHGQILE